MPWRSIQWCESHCAVRDKPAKDRPSSATKFPTRCENTRAPSTQMWITCAGLAWLIGPVSPEPVGSSGVWRRSELRDGSAELVTANRVGARRGLFVFERDDEGKVRDNQPCWKHIKKIVTIKWSVTKGLFSKRMHESFLCLLKVNTY